MAARTVARESQGSFLRIMLGLRAERIRSVDWAENRGSENPGRGWTCGRTFDFADGGLFAV